LQNVKVLSLFWCGVHALIILALVVSLSFVLSAKYPKERPSDYHDVRSPKHTYYNEYKDTQGKGIAFGALLGLNAVALILIMILVASTWKRSDYDEYSVDFKNKEEGHEQQHQVAGH
jgi:hypothetical protein